MLISLTQISSSTTRIESSSDLLPKNLKVGQVLKTTRSVNSDGRPVTRRLIVRRLPKSRPMSSGRRSLDDLPEIDDALEHCFDDD